MSQGEMAERPNAGALKASEAKASGGSNPSLAAVQRGSRLPAVGTLDFGEKRIWEELVRRARATVPSLAAKFFNCSVVAELKGDVA